MTTLLDINLLPFSNSLEYGISERTGFFASEPTRRSVRSRSFDRLILYLVMDGEILLAPGQQKGLLVELSKKFYNTPGSVTSAMKAVAEELNQVLLDSKRTSPEKGRYGFGLFSQCVLREEQIYLAQSGSVQAYWITDHEVRYFSPFDMSAKGLGLVRPAPVYFSQVSFQPNSTLILCGKKDTAWDDQMMQSLKSQGPESIRRRLVNQASGEFDAVIAQARVGKGKIHILQAKLSSLEETSAVGDSHRPTATGGTFIGEKQISQPARPGPYSTPGATAGFSQVQTSPKPISRGETQVGGQQKRELSTAGSRENRGSFAADEIQFGQIEKELSSPSRTSPGIFGKILSGIQWVLGMLGSGLGKLFPADLFHSLPSSAMAAIALAVPLIVVTVASVAYFQLGRSTQYEIYYTQAEQAAARAVEQEELMDQRVNWVSVLILLENAEKYQVTGATQALKLQARGALDVIDRIKRVNYQPAIQAGLPAGMIISDMVISTNELYLLDNQSGKVLRAKPTSQGYALDTSFQCGPSSSNVGSSGRLVDILAWPAGFEPEASVLGVDLDGNLYFCQAGKSPLVLRLALPQEAVGSVKAMDISGNELYVISQGSRAIWVFIQNAYDQAPRDYFSNDMEKPANIDTVTSMAVDNDDVYLLHSDGKLTYCYTADNLVVPIRCQAASLVDGREGRENAPLAGSPSLQRLMISSPPDPSLYFLEAANQSIYHVSLRSLIFQKHFFPFDAISSQPATAFTVNPETRRIFLATGNEIFYGSIP